MNQADDWAALSQSWQGHAPARTAELLTGIRRRHRRMIRLQVVETLVLGLVVGCGIWLMVHLPDPWWRTWDLLIAVIALGRFALTTWSRAGLWKPDICDVGSMLEHRRHQAKSGIRYALIRALFASVFATFTLPVLWHEWKHGVPLGVPPAAIAGLAIFVILAAAIYTAWAIWRIRKLREVLGGIDTLRTSLRSE